MADNCDPIRWNSIRRNTNLSRQRRSRLCLHWKGDMPRDTSQSLPRTYHLQDTQKGKLDQNKHLRYSTQRDRCGRRSKHSILQEGRQFLRSRQCAHKGTRKTNRSQKSYRKPCNFRIIDGWEPRNVLQISERLEGYIWQEKAITRENCTSNPLAGRTHGLRENKARIRNRRRRLDELGSTMVWRIQWIENSNSWWL